MSTASPSEISAAAQRAQVLAQALPYLRRYAGATVVVKYGGHAMGEEHLALEFGRDIALLKQVGINPVVVHGGGPQINAMLKRLAIQSTFIDGLRVTDAAMVEVVEMVLAGTVNKYVAGLITRAGALAVGVCGKDGNMIVARKVTRSKIDPDSHIERSARSRLRRRAGRDRCPRDPCVDRRRPGAGDRAGGRGRRRPDLQHQRGYGGIGGGGRVARGTAADADRRRGRAGQAEESDRRR